MKLPQIFSTTPKAIQSPETSGNRFQPLTFAKHFKRQALWNTIEQKTPFYLNTTLKVLLSIPLLLIPTIATSMEGLSNVGISLGNCLLSQRAVVIATAPTTNPLPTQAEPIQDVSKTEIAKSYELEKLERVKTTFASIDTPSSQLKYAADQGYLEGVKIALNNPDTNINYQSYMSRNDFGSTALMNAAIGGHKEIVELLLKAGANPNIIDPSRMSDCEFSIVDAIFKNGTTALMLATIGRNNIHLGAGSKEVVELLLNAKADPNIQDLKGNTALILSAEYGKTETVELLLNKGANPDIKKFKEDMVTLRSQNDWTALMVAARDGRKEIVELLLKAKADPNITDQYGRTALMLAAEKSHKEVVQLLLDAGAKTDIKDNYGKTVLSRTKNSDDIVQLINNHRMSQK